MSAPDLATRAARLVKHAPGCLTRETRVRVGARGDEQVICVSCGAFQFLREIIEDLPDAEDLAYSTRRLRHGEGCPGGVLDAVRGRLGDVLVTCTCCHRWATLQARPTTTTPTTRTRTAPRAPRATSFYVCRDHYAPVSWRGTGCPKCDAERAAALQARRSKRAKITITE